MKYKLIIGGIIAYILLALYGGIVIYIILKVISFANNPSSFIEPHGGIVYVLTTVGALVSALVISRMTVTTPGTDPAMFRQMGDNPAGSLKFIVWSYLILWTVIGLAALIIGVLVYPDISKTLGEFGTTWLGTAVAAGYAYFGIDPKV
jgi:hypothetical protein